MDYRRIIEIAKQRRNFGKLQNPTNIGKAQNTRCGDNLTLELLIENGKIKDAAFNGIGCALSIASFTILTEMIKEKDINEAKNISEKDLLQSLKIEHKNKCAVISLEALKKALEK